MIKLFISNRYYTITKRFLTAMSGIQPTGLPHIGNLFGAIQQWVDMQSNSQISKVYISIVDLHALTPQIKITSLNEHIYEMAASLIACGLCTEKIILFRQSHVQYHSLLAWILMCLCPVNRVQSLPQWKENVASFSEHESPNAGVLMYPILQAADILLYAPHKVPVGEDQIIHLDLTRHLRSKLIHWYLGKESDVLSKYLPVPETVQCQFPKIYSLKVPNKKMSKSESNIDSKIELTDSPDDIRRKIMRAVTDAVSEKITYDVDQRPGIANLINIYCSLKKITPEEALLNLGNLSKVQLKELLIDELIEALTPIRLRIFDLLKNRDEIDRILASGHETASLKAGETMEHILCHLNLKMPFRFEENSYQRILTK